MVDKATAFAVNNLHYEDPPQILLPRGESAPAVAFGLDPHKDPIYGGGPQYDGIVQSHHPHTGCHSNLLYVIGGVGH